MAPACCPTRGTTHNCMHVFFFFFFFVDPVPVFMTNMFNVLVQRTQSNFYG
jgi:hypothetical protein